jgi:mycobactin polyketide synthetase MbtD
MPTHQLPDGRIPALLSAHDEDLIGQDATAILDYLQSRGDSEDIAAAVASALLRTRRIRHHRAVVRAADRTELAAGLRALADAAEHPLVARSSRTTARRVAFVFPGQGNQWSSMGADAHQQMPAYRAEADRCAEAFAAAALPSPLPYLLNGEPMTDTDNWSQIVIQGAQFTHSVSLAQVWRACGVLPDITVGHSLGEVAAAYVAGTIALSDAVAIVAARATVVEELPGRYGMAVLGIGVDDARRFIADTAGWLEVSAVNGPSSTAVSGERDAVAGVVELAEKRGIFARAIAVDYPGHTSALEPLRGMFEKLLPAAGFRDAPVEFVGSACGDVVGADVDFADYWCQNLRNTVRFDQAVAMAVRRGANDFVELSAHPSLLSSLADLIDDESAVIVGSGRREERIVDQLAGGIAAVAVADRGYQWADVAGVHDHAPLWGFPNAPMRAIHLWATPEPLPAVPGLAVAVAVEQWEPRPEPEPGRRPRRGVAVVGSDGKKDRLTQWMMDAVAAHHDCHPAPLDEAEIIAVIAPALAQQDVMGAIDELVAARPLNYPRVVGPRCHRVWLVTAGGERVNAGESVVLPGQAALAAMHRCVGFEFPDQTFGHLDLPTRIIDTGGVSTCIDALLGDETEVALRENGSGGPGLHRYVRTLLELERLPSERPLDVSELDNVVITGGSGGIGLQYAQYCVEHGARRLTLLSRKGVDVAELNRLSHGHDVDVRAPACDITDPDALSLVAAEHGGDGATLLVHAAGAATFDAHDRLTDADLADAFGAKVAGLARMTGIWPLRKGVRVLLCSSVSGVWGGRGHTAYAASNRVLDVLAGQLRAKGLDALAVRWGLWQGTGVASADEIARIERSGLVAMDPGAAISASLRHHDGDPLVLAADFDMLRIFFESQGVQGSFAVASETSEREVAAGDAGSDNVSYEQPVADVVRAQLASALSLDGPASVDMNAPLVDLGVDSLLGLDLRKRLRHTVGRSIPLAKLLGGITGTELIDALQTSSSTGLPPPEIGRAERGESSRD